jgi:hypothetical protein
MLRTNCFKLAMALMVLMGTSVISSGQVQIERLPQVEDFSVTFLETPTKAGNAVLSITFREDTKLPEDFSVKMGGRTVEFNNSGLKNDEIKGDRTFSALAFVSEKDVLTRRMREGGTFPIFNGRQHVGFKEFPPIKEILPNQRISLTPVGNPAAIDPERSLMVTNPLVVQDKTRTRTNCATGSMGVWSFGYLMTEMANQSQTGIDPRDFTMEWLLRWYKDEVVNTFTIGERRVGIKALISGWRKDAEGKLDLSFAPFRLLAIVNRADLRGSNGAVYGQQTTNAGELRFVFGVVDPVTCSPQRFTTILEYGVKSDSCETTKAWAASWANLSNFTLGSIKYNNFLQELTERVVRANADPERPNGSSINQVRTNEISLGNGQPWELREFQLDQRSFSSQLNSVTIKQTPDSGFNGSGTLTNFINQFENELLTGTHVVTDSYLGSPFLAAAIEYDASDFWDADGINNNEARHQFSLNTCNSCHGRESGTGFLQVGTAPFGPSTPALSGFLRGNTPSTTDVEFFPVSDPVDGTIRKFNDLLRRRTDLDALINSSCRIGIEVEPGGPIVLQPVTMIH